MNNGKINVKMTKGLWLVFLGACSAILYGVLVLFNQISGFLLSFQDTFFPVAFSTALCFILVGLILLCAVFSFSKSQKLLSIILILFASLSFLGYFVETPQIENIFFLIFRTGGASSNLIMGANTALALICTGFVFIFLTGSQKKYIAILIQAMIFVVFLVGLLGFVGIELKLNLLYPKYYIFRMFILTAVGLIMLSIMLWYLWSQTEPFKKYFEGKELQKISLINTSILLATSLLIGLIGFSILARQYESEIKESLKKQLNDKIAIINECIERPFAELKALLDSEIYKNLQNKSDQVKVKHFVNLIKNEGFSAVSLINKNQRVLESEGKFIKPQITIPLQFKQPASLQWNGTWYLEVNKNISIQQQNIVLKLQWPLDTISKMFDGYRSAGKTDEMIFCRKNGANQAQCFPTRLRREVFTTPLVIKDKKIPMNYALNDKAGAITSIDYRGKLVIAAYSGLLMPGLGIALKVDAAEAYTNAREQLEKMFPWALVILALGAVPLNWQIIPLIRKIVDSKKEAVTRQAELKVLNEQLQTIMNSSSHSIITTDLQGNIQVFNRGAEKMLGYSAEEMIGKHTPEIIHDPDEVISKSKKLSEELGITVKPGFETFVAKLAQQDVIEDRWKYLRKDGSSFPVVLSVTALRGQNNNIVGYMGIAQDITEQRKLEDLKNEFISIVSHELRTPLTSIQGSLSLLINGVGGKLPPKVIPLLSIAKQNTERLIRLINDILDLEKIEAGRIDLNMEVLDLRIITEEAILANQGFAEQFAVKLISSFPDSPILVEADHDRLIQVFTNLISNAIKFSPKNEAVFIKIMHENNCAKVMIHNEGEAIPVAFQEQVFDKFSQADASLARKRGGTGLGLSISKAIIEGLNGSIGFTSDFQKGTTFYFKLPLYVESKEESVKTHEKNLSALVCEKDEAVALYFKTMLEQQDIETKVAKTAEQAKQLLRLHHYDVLLLDLMLPDQDSPGLIREIKSSKKFSRLPIVIIAMEISEAKQIINGSAFSIVDWIEKEIDPQRLQDAILSIKSKIAHTIPQVLHVEDDKAMAEVLARLLKKEVAITDVADLEAARKMLREKSFDLVILDINLPDGSGIELLNELNQKHIPVIVFSAYELQKDFAHRVFKYVVKAKTSYEELLLLIKTAINESSTHGGHHVG